MLFALILFFEYLFGLRVYGLLVLGFALIVLVDFDFAFFLFADLFCLVCFGWVFVYCYLFAVVFVLLYCLFGVLVCRACVCLFGLFTLVCLVVGVWFLVWFVSFCGGSWWYLCLRLVACVFDFVVC